VTTTSVTSGQSISGLLLQPGATLDVLVRGSALGIRVVSGSEMFVSSGGLVSGTIVNSGGLEYVGASGSATGDVVSAAGLAVVVSGGHTSGITVHSGAVVMVVGSSVASAVNVANDGLLIVLNGGSATGTTGPGNVVSGSPVVLNTLSSATGEGSATSGQSVAASQQQVVCYSGLAVGTTVGTGGQQFVDGGVTSGTVLASGGSQFVFLGVASGTQVVAGAVQAIFGGSAFGTVVSGAADQLVYGGGVSGTQVASGGVETVYAGTVAATVLTQGSTQILSGGIASSVQVGAGCAQVVSGGSAIGTMVGSGGDQLVSAGTVSGTVVNGGGTQDMRGGLVISSKMYSGGRQLVSAGVASGSLVIDGGVEIVGSAGSAVGTQTIEGGGVVVSAGASFAGTVQFVGADGTLTLANPTLFSATVSGFGAGETIDLPTLPFTASGTATLTENILSVTEGQMTQSVRLAPNGLAGSVFYLSSDAGGGTQVSPACFAAGTRIATERGEVPVEALRPGDRVRLAGGGSAPVVWLGHRTVKPRFHPRPSEVRPVRVAAHAFGRGRPMRDVFLSPDHAVFSDDVLIPVRYLLNGGTVRQVDVAAVTYWHVELPAHAVLLAEGLPAESFLDTGNRAAFANGGAVASAFPDFARDVWARDAAAPLVTEGPVRDLVYRRLLAQALSLGWRTEDAGEGAVTWMAPSPRASPRDDKRGARAR